MWCWLLWTESAAEKFKPVWAIPCKWPVRHKYKIKCMLNTSDSFSNVRGESSELGWWRVGSSDGEGWQWERISVRYGRTGGHVGNKWTCTQAAALSLRESDYLPAFFTKCNIIICNILQWNPQFIFNFNSMRQNPANTKHSKHATYMQITDTVQ